MMRQDEEYRCVGGTSKRLKPSATSRIASQATSMDAMPTLVLAGVLAFADHDELHAAEQVCRALYATVRSEALWEKLVRNTTVFTEEDAPTSDLGWKDLACLVSRPCNPNIGLLEEVVACSSVDRPVETPSNTLQPSRCWLNYQTALHDHLAKRGAEEDELSHESLARTAQIECGCEMGDACYWSTTPSTDKNTEDFIEYSVFPNSVVSEVQIIPYRAYWHPETPTYGPMAASVSFYTRQSATAGGSPHEVLLFHSPVYPLANEMEMQVCRLPKHIWVPRGAIMRVNLHGRHQAETFELPGFVPPEDHVPNYYTSVSFIGAVGVTLAQCYDASLEPPAPYY